MKKLLLICVIILFANIANAQQRIDIIDNGSSITDKYISKEIDGEERCSALVIIQSTTKLKYTVMGIAVSEDDIKRSADSDGVYVDTLYFYVNDFDSRRRLMLYAEGYPSEEINLNMKPKNSYNYMVIEPNVTDEPVQSSGNVDKLITQAKLAIVQCNYEYAEQLYTKVLESKPTDEIYANLANSQYLQANILKENIYDRAIINADKALAINPNNYLANMVCGLSHAYKAKRLSFGREINECIKAVEHLFKAIEIAPDGFAEYELTGDTYDRLFTAVALRNMQANAGNANKLFYYKSLASQDELIIRYKEFEMKSMDPTLYKYGYNRMMCYKRALKQKTAPELYFKLGDAYVALDKFDEAIDCYNKSITATNNKGKYRIDKINKRIIK